MTIEELLAATGLTANDFVPIYDAEATQNVEPTQKVTAAQLAAAVKVLASLVNTTEMNAAISQSTAITTVTLGSTGYTAQVTYNVRQAIKQSGRVTIQLTCVFNIDLPSSKVVATVPDGYRPNAEVLIPALITTNSDAMLFEYVIVKPNGEIIQQSTNSCRKVFVCADYAL